MGGYLDELDELLAAGLSGVDASVVDATVSSIVTEQQPDGGFRGRQGGSDLYYTDFALRTLSLLQPAHSSLRSTANYVASLRSSDADLIASFDLLNCHRLLMRSGVASSIDASGLAGRVLNLLELGLSQRRIGAYRAFLACLCLQAAGHELPCAAPLQQLVTSLQRPDGGYAESPSGPHSQTNATAAAVAVLRMCRSPDKSRAGSVARFLAAMQTGDGGLMAHAQAGKGDLLSTFTGLLTLWSLERFDLIDVAAVARFLRRVADPKGGFRASCDDSESDAEYTWYGIATMSLLRLFSCLAEML